MQCYRAPKADELSNRWQTDPRWKGSRRDYTAKDVTGLRGSVHIESHPARAAGPSGSGSCCTPSPTSPPWAPSRATRQSRWSRPV